MPDEDQTSPMHSNPLVATGVIPANLYNSFVIPEMNHPKQKLPRVVTKSHLLTSDEHVQMYNKKVSKKRQAEEAKQKRKDEWEQRKAAKEKQKKQGSEVRTRGRIRKRGGNIQTHGGKRNWQYITPEESTTEEEVEHDDQNTESDEEEWECKACDEDDGVANDFIGCDKCDWWFHVRC